MPFLQKSGPKLDHASKRNLDLPLNPDSLTYWFHSKHVGHVPPAPQFCSVWQNVTCPTESLVDSIPRKLNSQNNAYLHYSVQPRPLQLDNVAAFESLIDHYFKEPFFNMPHLLPLRIYTTNQKVMLTWHSCPALGIFNNWSSLFSLVSFKCYQVPRKQDKDRNNWSFHSFSGVGGTGGGVCKQTCSHRQFFQDQRHFLHFKTL